MADVKVPPLLHKMSLASQKAWYKKHNMEMPSAPAAGGKSAAQAKKDVGEINKQKAKEKSALQKALETSPKQKELKKSSARVQQMAANALAFGGQRPGGDLTTARGIVRYIRGGGYLKAGRLGEETLEERSQENKEKLKNYVRTLGTRAKIKGLVPFDQWHSPLRAGRKVLQTTPTNKMNKFLKKEEANQIDEVTKKEAEAVIGGPVKEKPKMAPGKQPAGYRYVRGLARKAMKAGLKKEEVVVVEQDDTMEKKEMAQTQLHFIGYAAKEILEFIDMGGEIEEWYQNKLSKVQSEVESLHSYIEGEKRRTGMVKEEEQIAESVTHWEYTGTVNGKDYSLTIPRGDDLVNHLNHKKIMRQNPHLEPHEAKAVAETSGEDEEHVEVEHNGKTYTHYVTNDQEPRMVRTEEVEHVEEKYMGFKKLKASIAAKGGARDPAAVAAAIGRKKYGKEKFQAAAAAGKKLGEEAEVVAEAEGKVAVTPKEKDLAAHHGDPKRITYGDVIKARLKSAAAKKMGKQ